MAYDPNLFSNAQLNASYLGINPPGNLYYEAPGTNLGWRNIPAPPTFSDTAFTLSTPLDWTQRHANYVDGPLPTNAARLAPGGLPEPNNAPTVVSALNQSADYSEDYPVPGPQLWSMPGTASAVTNQTYNVQRSTGGVPAAPRFVGLAEPQFSRRATDQSTQLGGNVPGGFVMQGTNRVACTAGMEDLRGRRPIGAGILSSGEQVWAARNLASTSDTSAVQPAEIAVADTDFFKKNASSQTWGAFTDDAFNTQSRQHTLDNRVLTGVLVNTNTGEMAETYVDEIPPPDRDRSLPPSEVNKPHRALIAHQGGIDFNNPLRQKSEVQANLPAVNAGRNVWGDQLYADERRQRMTQYTNADIWGNRNGMYSTEPQWDRHPTGYEGFVNRVRWTPYAPPTQRGRTDLAWKSQPGNSAGDIVPAMTSISKVDLTPCTRVGPAQSDTGQLTKAEEEQLRPFLKEIKGYRPVLNVASEGVAPVVRVFQMDLPDTMRSDLEGLGVPGSVFGVQDLSSGRWVFAYESDLNATVRSVIEAATRTADVSGSTIARVQPDGDTADPFRGDKAVGYVSNTGVLDQGHNGGVAIFNVQDVRKQAREFPNQLIAVNSPEGIVVPRYVPEVRCTRSLSAADQSRLNNLLHTRPEYFAQSAI